MNAHLAVALFSLLGFALSLALLALALTLRRRRRRQSPTADPEAAAATNEAAPPSSKNILLKFLRFRKPSSRVEPAITSAVKATAAEDEEGDVETWSAACFGPSMLLYTIKEEEVEVSGTISVVDGDGEEEEAVFVTPCSSPAYYTPATSPLREAEECR